MATANEMAAVNLNTYVIHRGLRAHSAAPSYHATANIMTQQKWLYGTWP
ncbi:MAG: hypothetical protein AAFN38_01490 [Cyanobacteria bacterium J06560_5]